MKTTKQEFFKTTEEKAALIAAVAHITATYMKQGYLIKKSDEFPQKIADMFSKTYIDIVNTMNQSED